MTGNEIRDRVSNCVNGNRFKMFSKIENLNHTEYNREILCRIRDYVTRFESW